ncbi:Guanine nucleotide-binding protein subunit gamma 3 [Camellia lanceoleosa]|uniref:Guanine nucleotide-binding protein subunit gamma 3 n=1 Tax=Camellia lanceoleosa TaxID=1840588 RepID=A0ACC0I205_9ERIC|nr:Guanine nucleotide-binding protein subunit gamma 3 [Camellia lanceoleosa]
MAGSSSSSSSVVPSLPPPRPKSPPEYPDLYGKRRELAKVQILEREITFLEGELKFVGNLQPASQCCKEVADFMVANSDPFIPTGYAEHHVLTSHGFAVLGALLILKCRTAAIAIYATAVHVFIVVQYQNAHVVQYQNADADADVQYQNADVVLGHAPNALTRSHAARATSNVAFHDDALPAQIALVDGDALVPNVQR